jgi:Tfp pilus assembly protein PilN
MNTVQHSIDLMPASIRERSQAGVRLGQFMAMAIAALTLTVAVATHSRMKLGTAQDRLFEIASQTERVFVAEARAAELRHQRDAIDSYTQLYRRLSYPLAMGDVLATIVSMLPESVTLDQVDLNAGTRSLGAGARSRGVETQTQTPPRMLIGEIAGFAANDQHIAELVAALERTPPFTNVSLDFSRGRRVHDRDAREFRLSFRISLDQRYQVTHVDRPGTSGSGERLGQAAEGGR